MESEKSFGLVDFPPLISQIENHDGTNGGKKDFIEDGTDKDSADKEGAVIEGSANDKEKTYIGGKDWRGLFPKPIAVTSINPMKFTPPVEVNGKLQMEAQTVNFTAGIKKCENKVVVFFCGEAAFVCNSANCSEQALKFQKRGRTVEARGSWRSYTTREDLEITGAEAAFKWVTEMKEAHIIFQSDSQPTLKLLIGMYAKARERRFKQSTEAGNNTQYVINFTVLDYVFQNRFNIVCAANLSVFCNRFSIQNS